MNQTPRLPSAYPPPTPRTNAPRYSGANNLRRNVPSPSTQPPSSPITKPVQNAAPAKPQEGGPLIPLEVVDAPTQRFYVAAFYVGLVAWRLYNAWNVTDDLDSTWLFLKWIALDSAFFIALPALKIPWLEFSLPTTITLWTLHALANAFLMYKIPIPILSWLGAMVKVAYDRELSISEHRVKPADILHNSSIILGKQIIQILPEGSAILNPERRSYCLDGSRTTIELSIQINQTTPMSIELLRHDLETDDVETILIGSKQAKKLKNEADRGHSKSDTKTPRILHYSVSKTGLYELSRVMDQSKLEVRKRSFDVAVVPCPKASVSVDANHKCSGDLSGVSLHVDGVPPFKVTYSRRINHQTESSVTQSIQPEEYEDGVPSGGEPDVVSDPKHPHRGWTKTRKVSVQINESLHQNGTWSYHVEEVEDGLGNKAMFDTDKIKKGSPDDHARSLTVHRRPVLSLNGCSTQTPLKARQGQYASLPVRVEPHHLMPASDWPMKVKYSFTPETDDQIAPIEEREFEMAHGGALPQINQAGRYSLASISSQFCQGEINEPSSCNLYNPPRPDIAIQHEEIFDKCAGNPVGMDVNFDFTGTPPFIVQYSVTHLGEVTHKKVRFNNMRGRLEFHERSAGSYIYQINSIEDEVYDSVSVKDRNLVLKQDIKPTAEATFIGGKEPVQVCLGQPVSKSVRFQGEGPWHLDYEVVHGAKRKKYHLESDTSSANIDLPTQSEGGNFSIVLTGVQDQSKCKQVLNDERRFEVRPERPSASFGDIEGHRTLRTLEGVKVKIPVRLQGLGPWTVEVRNMDKGTPSRVHELKKANSFIAESEAGTYELVSVSDRCPGVVDAKANKFQIEWIQRPTLNVRDSSVDHDHQNTYRKAPVCQGDEDSLNLALTGNPPYALAYQIHTKPLKGSPGSTSNKPVSVASNNVLINMDSSKAGEYTYVFNELADDRYKHDRRHFSPFSVVQQVYALPSARFANPGKTYGYCKDDPALTAPGASDTEQIPIVLVGKPPFSIEIATTHHGASRRPEITRVRDISDNTYSWPLNRGAFDLGTHTLQIRSVKDSRGCESIIDRDSSSVRIHVSSPPAIIPLESVTDYCVGDRVSFSLSGQAPFDVFYTFQNREKKAHVKSHDFRRIAESPGDFVITGVSDDAMGPGKCKARKDIRKVIHPYPSVKISQGRTTISDIHEGGEVDIHFEFTGTPPFEFTYTRSENAHRNSKKKPAVLETRHDSSTEFTKTIPASEEGTYEVVAIKDRYCAYSAVTGARSLAGAGTKPQKMLKNV